MKPHSSTDGVLKILKSIVPSRKAVAGLTAVEMAEKLHLNPSTVVERLRPLILSGAVRPERVSGIDIAGRHCTKIVYVVTKK